MQDLLHDIRQCRICEGHLPLGPRPIATAHPNSKIVIIGQAPGTKVHAFGLKHKGYNNVINGTDHKWGYLNQEENDELGLGWLTFRYRNYMPEIGRFFGVDPVAESFVDISTYQFAHNTPVWKIELEGLEGIKSQEFDANGNFKNHVVEKNVVVLTQKAIPMPTFEEGTRENKIKRVTARVNRKNRNIASANASKVAAVKKELKTYFNNAKNSSGESVKFDFNVTSHAVDDTSKTSMQFAIGNGITSSETQQFGSGKKVARAAVFTTASTDGNRGLTSGNFNVRINSGETLGNGVFSHEVGHSLMTRTNNSEHRRTGLMSLNPGQVTPTTVDKILEDSYEK